MGTKRMNWKKRRFLLTGQTDEAHGMDVWAVMAPSSPSRDVVARYFCTDSERRAWIAQNPRSRRAVGKRHYAVKAFRTQKAQEARHERARQKARDAAYTTWMWESP